ncbi:MAG TPA: hypothetical protein VKF35_05275 [Hyphomicrobiaceae bacterium]|nr:hypothetical protein [Hyphomicrobiaceae bacterium]
MSYWKRIGAMAGRLLIGCGLVAAGIGSAQAACNLQSARGQIKRVVHITFDNVHFLRDNPNVPSDLELMPNLLDFVLNNGTISANHHTPLISHTATDILTALSGLYGDRMGVPVANSYGFFRPDGSVGFSPSFLYWTALGGDGIPLMVNEKGKTAPAPWVPFTRAGCDVGAFSVANIEIESIPADIRTIFGVGSPEDLSVSAALALPNVAANQPARQKPNTDFLGIAIHCALGSSLCNNPRARPDLLPDEPGGYVGFKALFGNVNVAPVICATAPTAPCGRSGNVKDTDGNDIKDAYGQPGFPNIFNPTASQSLGYAATMLEAGLPVVYLYIADAHDRNPLPLDPVTNRPTAAHAFGPGEEEYVSQLRAYDAAFGKFFARLAAAGITKDNTLFLIVPDENDHFVGGPPSPVNCNGVTVPCTYAAIGEISATYNRLLFTQRRNSTPFLVHSDDAPTVYITGNPTPTAPVTRTMERDSDALTAVNPITGNTDKLSAFLADQAEMKLLHMVTSSSARTPTFTMFGNPDYFFFTANPLTDCAFPPACIEETPNFAWNHGDVQEDITRTWLAMVGPGVRRQGRADEVFSDHTDVRPTMMALLGLKDSYIHDGRVLVEKLQDFALPGALRDDEGENFVKLAQLYKELNAPLGSVGQSSLEFATRSIVADDVTYDRYLAKIDAITKRRDALADQIKSALDAAEFAHQAIDDHLAHALSERAKKLIEEVDDLAAEHRKDEHEARK